MCMSGVPCVCVCLEYHVCVCCVVCVCDDGVVGKLEPGEPRLANHSNSFSHHGTAIVLFSSHPQGKRAHCAKHSPMHVLEIRSRCP